MQVRLKVPTGHFIEPTPEEAAGQDSIDKDVMIVYTGTFDSMDGEVSITPEILNRIESAHNKRMKGVDLTTGGGAYKDCPPIQLDHSTSATMTVGRLIGNVRVSEAEVDGEMKPALFGRMRILGAENVQKVADGRWTHVSMGADLESGELSELTITPFPAAPRASMLSKNKPGEPMEQKEKLRKHLMDKHKLSEKDADDKLSKMSKSEMDGVISEINSSDGRPMDSARESIQAAEGKNAMEPTVSFQSKGEFIRLAKSFKSTVGVVQLQARTRQINARLSKLRAENKLTPGEVKGINVAKLAAMSDDHVDFFIDTFKNRQPVLDQTVRGTTKAVQLSKIQKDYRLARLELESRMNMPSKRADAAAKLSRLAEEEKAALKQLGADTGPVAILSEAPPVPGKPDAGDMPPEEHMSHMSHACKMAHACLESGDTDQAKEHMKTLMSHLEAMQPEKEEDDSEDGQQRMSEETDENTEEDEKKKAKMSSSSQNLKRLQTKFEELIALVGPTLGISSKDLE